MEDDKAKPWYKEPWPFILISITGLGVVAGSTLAYIGLSNPPELVSGEFEQLGRGLTDVNTRTVQAKTLGLHGQIRIDGDAVVLRLSAHDTGTLPESLLVQFEHPASSEFDATAVLTRAADGDYVGSLGAAPHGRARIVVADLPRTWWLAGRLDGLAQAGAELSPKRL